MTKEERNRLETMLKAEEELLAFALLVNITRLSPRLSIPLILVAVNPMGVLSTKAPLLETSII